MASPDKQGTQSGWNGNATGDPGTECDVVIGEASTPTTRADRAAQWLVCIVGVVLSLGAAVWLYKHAKIEGNSAFDRYADERVQRLRYDLDVSLESLRPLRMLFAASERVEQDEFARFANDLIGRQSALCAVAWVARVPDADRAMFEAAARAAGSPDFEIRERDANGLYRRADQRADYLVMKYLTPLEPNQALLGSDLGAVRLSNHALIRAMKGEDLAVSKPSRIPDAFGGEAVVLVFLREIAAGELSESPNPEHGVVMGAFSLPKLLSNNDRTMGSLLPRIRLRVTDQEVPDLVVPFVDADATSDADDGHESDELSKHYSIVIGGRVWNIQATSPRDFWHRGAWDSVVVGGAGLGMTGVLMLFISGRVSCRRAEEHVRLLTSTLRSANESLAAKERRLQSLFDAAIDPLWDWNVRTNHDVLSPSWLRLLGYDSPPTDPTEVAWSNRMHPDDKARTWEALKRCLSGECETYEAQYRLRHQSRGWIQVSSRGCVVERDAAGQALRMIGNVTDMTAILDAQQSLRDSEERFRQIVANIDSVFWMMSVEPRQFIYISPAFERIWGRPTSDLTEKRIAWIETLHPNDREIASTAFDGWLNGAGQYDVIYRIFRPGGAVRWVRDRGFGVHDEQGKRYRIAGFAEDVTARVQSEAALVESEQRLSGLFEQAAVGIAEVDLSGRLQFVNLRLCEILGFPQIMLLGRTLSQLAHPDDRVAQDARNRQMLAEEINGYTAPARFVRGDGVECWCEVAVSVVRDAEGLRKSFMVVMEDVTARRNAEAAANETTERHRLALDAVAGIVYEIDVPRRRVIRASGVERMLGYQPEDLSLQGWAGHIHEADIDQVAREFWYACEHESGYSIEYRVRHKDGHFIHMLGRGIVVRNEQGETVRVVGCSMDVSELKEARHALRTMEDRNRAILRAVPDHLFYVDREGRYLGYHTNRPHELLVQPDEFLGRTVSQVVPPELAEPTTRLLGLLFQTGEPQSFEIQRERNGAVKFTEYRFVPASDEEALILVRDITERMRAELALRESEERYRVLFDNMPEPIVVLQDQRLAIGNGAALRLFGVGCVGSLRELDFVGSILAEDRSVSVERLHAAMLSVGEPVVWRARIQRGDGSVRTVEFSASRISFAGQHAVLSVARDLTSQLESESMLNEVRDRLENVLDRLPDIVAYDSSPDHLYVGENIVRLIGHEARYLVSEPAKFRSLIHPDDQGHIAGRMRLFFARQPGSNQTLQFRLLRADGSEVWVEDRMVLLPPTGGKQRVVGVLIDVTQLKHTEFSLRGMMAERDHRVKNNLASVIAIANHMFRGAESLGEYHAELIARIRALANVHQSLAQSRWKHVEVLAMVRETLAPYDRETPRSPGRVHIEGKETLLPGRMGPPIALTLHELATNAAKHGALACAEGQVHVTWELETGVDAPVLRLRWRETGVRIVEAPQRRGFGRDMIETGLRHELGATVRFDFLPSGLNCEIDVPIVPEDPTGPRFGEGFIVEWKK